MIQVSEFKNVLEVMDYFKEESTCKNYLEQKRWGGTVCCPDCGKTKIYRTNRGFRCADRDCDRKFTVRVGTIMECSNIKLRFWFAAMYLILAHKKGISSLQLARDLGVCQKTAWFMNHRIRKIMTDSDTQKFTVSVSADETFIGGKNKNRHKNKKIPNSQGRSSLDKTPVLGIKEKGGKIRTFKIKNTETNTLQPILVANVEKGAVLMTDEWGGYSDVKTKFNHKIVNHSAKQFVDGMVHVNDVENYWSHLKRSINGIYHWVSVKHLDSYCNEMSYRFNSRGKTDCSRFDYVLAHLTGRLTWKDLVAAPEDVIALSEREKYRALLEQEDTPFKSMAEYLKYKSLGEGKQLSLSLGDENKPA